MFKDSEGKFCLAKTSFASCLAAFLIVILNHEFDGGGSELNYEGMAMFLGVVGTVYFSRSHTKATTKNPKSTDADMS